MSFSWYKYQGEQQANNTYVSDISAILDMASGGVVINSNLTSAFSIRRGECYV